MFKLQQNIPIPPTIRPNARGKRRKYPFEQMQVGSFFFIPGKRPTSYFSTVGAELGIKLTSRLTFMKKTKSGWEPCEQDEPGATLGVGVWRAK